MAKVKCKVRFGKFKPNKRGYRTVMDGGGVQADVAKRATKVAAAANGVMSPTGYVQHPGYEVKDFQGKLAKGKLVRTKTDHARNDNAQHNTLLKSLGGA